MYTRYRLPFLQQLLGEFPAVAILGPRQVGKTTLALELVRDRPSTLYLDLESPADAAKLADPDVYFDAHADRLLVIDEVQRAPALFADRKSVV